MNLDLVNQRLLTPNKLEIKDLQNLLEIAKNHNVDYSDLYLQSCCNENWILEDSIVKSGSYHINHGVGIRVITREKTGFSYTNQLTIQSLTKEMINSINAINNSITESNTISNYRKNNKCIFTPNQQEYSIYSEINPLSSISNEEKIDLLMRIDKISRSESSFVKRVKAVLSGSHEHILILATDGTLESDIRPLVKLSVLVQVECYEKRDQGFSGGGNRIGYNDLFNKSINGEICIDYWARNAVRMGLTNLNSVSAPAGSIPVVLGPGWPGILIHEAVGHGLEADFNRKGISIFSNKIGKQVASELCTIVDDATITESRGSLAIDDEGTPGQYTILIKDGILQGYMQDKFNAKFMGVKSTGNGRRESYSDLPIPRMTNTYMLPGKSTPEEIISSVDYGVYATNFGGGQVDITSGQFVFSASEAFLIEKGHVTKPVKGATLIGSGMEIMQSITMIGNDLSLDSGVGICVKNGQQIPVSVGQPTIKLNKITVGGTG